MQQRIDPDYLAQLGVVGEQTWHVPFIMGVIAAGAAVYFWPQKHTFFADAGYTPRPKMRCIKYVYRNGRKRCAKFSR